MLEGDNKVESLDFKSKLDELLERLGDFVKENLRIEFKRRVDYKFHTPLSQRHPKRKLAWPGVGDPQQLARCWSVTAFLLT